MSIRPKSLVVGNWKMNGSLAANAELLAAVLAGAAGAKSDMAVCVPYPYLWQTQAVLRNSSIAWGAQDVSEHAAGAYTGEVSATMLVEFGCGYVIVGHSERRSFYGDSDTVVAAKYMAAQKAGVIPVLCVGETLAERDAGITGEVVVRQLNAIIDMAGAASLANSVVAYEPVWAIGTGRTATPEQAQEVHAVIRTRVAAVEAGVADGLRILYGGSVKPGNAGELFGQPDINGGLIGGASLVAADFLAICSAT